MWKFLFFLFLILPSTGQAAIQIPSNMGAADRQAALRVLGLGTGYKLLGDPYPLGGYMGFELGVSYEMLSTSAISALGSGASKQSDLSYANFTMGKGLFYDVDFYLQFAPLGQHEKFSSYGGAIRWGVLELESAPVHFSLQAAANSASFQNKINTTTQNFDLVGGWDFQDLVLYGGVGFIRSSGTFIGGATGVTDTNETLTEAVSESHTFAGLSVKYDTYFLSVQVDRASQLIYALKMGVRY